MVQLSPKQADAGPRTRVTDLRKRTAFIYDGKPPPVSEDRYYFGDAFCGVGGCSAGARSAGLKIRWAFDADSRTARVYSQNFPRADVHVAPVDHFLVLNDLRHVDVMHISPPCQAWSLAHTVAGKDDDANSATLFSVKELLLKSRPRVATMEQVCGLARKADNRYFPLFLANETVLLCYVARFPGSWIFLSVEVSEISRLWSSSNARTDYYYRCMVCLSTN